jgi:hypothetical protein
MPYYSDRYVFAPDQQFTAADWKEIIGNQQAGGETISLDGSQATIQVHVPWQKKQTFAQFCVGWSYVVSSAATKLTRQNPVQHPSFPTMYASSVSFQAESPVGQAGVGTKVSGLYSTSLKVAKYHSVTATVQFTERPYFILPDAVIAVLGGFEGYRNTYFEPVPSIEILSAEGLNNLSFKYNSGGPGTSPIPAPFGTLMSKVTQTLNWMNVPHEYINGSNQYTFLPKKILNCVGRVNSAPFFGFPANTLLLQAPVFVRHRFPTPTADGTSGYFGWNIKLPLQYFEPNLGIQSGVPPGEVFAGHQVLPYRKNLLWYPAVREDGTSKIYPEADFKQIFERVTD